MSAKSHHFQLPISALFLQYTAGITPRASRSPITGRSGRLALVHLASWIAWPAVHQASSAEALWIIWAASCKQLSPGRLHHSCATAACRMLISPIPQPPWHRTSALGTTMLSFASHALLYPVLRHAPVWSGSMEILPRASVERGQDKKWSARAKYQEALITFGNFSSGALDGPRVFLPRGSLERNKDLNRAARQKYEKAASIFGHSS